MKQDNRIYVWDRFIRFFHWSLVLSFLFAYMSSQAGMQFIHSYIGYFITMLILSRIVWGYIGSDYARFSSFLFSPAFFWKYLNSIRSGHPQNYLGHNPAGSYMVYALLLILLSIIVTGFISLAVIEFEGPFVAVLINMSDETAFFFQDLHRFLIDVMWVLVFFHIMGVVTASIQHQENLPKAMITGYKSSKSWTFEREFTSQ